MTSNTDLAKKIQKLMPEPGILDTNVPNLSLIRRNEVMEERCQLIYDPCIYIVIQGRKSAFLNDENYIYDDLNYLVLTVPLPLECQILKANVDNPYLAMRIKLDIQFISELVSEIQSETTASQITTQRGIYVSRLDDNIRTALDRLLTYVGDSSAAKVLSPLTIKELLFYAIRGEQGEQLKSFAYQDKHNFQIAQVINFIQNHYSENMEVAELASKAGMSQSSFHQHFKTITNASPIQYIKTIRLHAAKRKLLHDNQSASDAAYNVGYASASQFTREYRRFFGVTPTVDIKRRCSQLTEAR